MKNSNIKRDSKLKAGIHLTLIQFGLLVIPIITIPYIVDKVGVEKFGAVIFFQSIMSLLSVVINYGFAQTGAPDIAKAASIRKLNFEYSNVLFSKIFLLFLCLIIALIIYAAVPKFHNDKYLYFLSLIILIFNCLDISFLFQGIERMKDYMLLNLASNIFVVILLFYLIKKPEDYILIPVIFFGPRVLAGGLSILYAAIVFKIKPNIFFFAAVLRKLKKGLNFFATNIFSILYAQTSSIMLGFLGGDISVGIYSLADKLCFAYTAIQSKIGVVYQPQIAKDFKKGIIEGSNKAKENIFFTLIAAIPVFFFCQFFAEDILFLFFQNKGADSVNILRLLSLNFISIGLNGILCGNILLSIDRADEMLKPSIITAIINIFLGGTLIYFFQHTGAALTICLIEFGVRWYYFFRIKKFQIFVWSKQITRIIIIYSSIIIISLLFLKYFSAIIVLNFFLKIFLITAIFGLIIAYLLKTLKIICLKNFKLKFNCPC